MDLLGGISKLETNIKIKNLKKQTETDQSYYSGSLKLAFVNNPAR